MPMDQHRKAVRDAYDAYVAVNKGETEEYLARLQAAAAASTDASMKADLEIKVKEETIFLSQIGVTAVTYSDFLRSRWAEIKGEMIGGSTDALLDEREAVEAEWDKNFPGEPLEDEEDDWDYNEMRGLLGDLAHDV